MNVWELAVTLLFLIVALISGNAILAYLGAPAWLVKTRAPRSLKSEAWSGGFWGFVVTASVLLAGSFGLRYSKHYMQLSIRGLRFLRISADGVLFGELALAVLVAGTLAGALWAAYEYDKRNSGAAA